MPAVLFREVADFSAIERGGDGFYQEERLTFRCPCGCYKIAGVSIAGPRCWEWDGNREKPTITPSILIDGGHWHGFLTDGVFRSC